MESALPPLTPGEAKPWKGQRGHRGPRHQGKRASSQIILTLLASVVPLSPRTSL